MTKNAELFRDFIPYKELVTFSPKGQVSQTSYLYTRGSLILASKSPTLHMNARKPINSMAPKSDRKWCEQHLPNQSMHPLLGRHYYN